jgi:hypothetical protein
MCYSMPLPSHEKQPRSSHGEDGPPKIWGQGMGVQGGVKAVWFQFTLLPGQTAMACGCGDAQSD